MLPRSRPPGKVRHMPKRIRPEIHTNLRATNARDLTSYGTTNVVFPTPVWYPAAVTVEVTKYVPDPSFCRLT